MKPTRVDIATRKPNVTTCWMSDFQITQPPTPLMQKPIVSHCLLPILPFPAMADQINWQNSALRTAARDFRNKTPFSIRIVIQHPPSSNSFWAAICVIKRHPCLHMPQSRNHTYPPTGSADEAAMLADYQLPLPWQLNWLGKQQGSCCT